MRRDFPLSRPNLPSSTESSPTGTKIVIAIAIWAMALIPFTTSSLVQAELATVTEMSNVAQNWVTEVAQERTWAGGATPIIDNEHELWHNGVLVGRYYEVLPLGFVLVPSLREMTPVKVYSDESNLSGDQEGGPLLLAREDLYRRMEVFKTVYGSYSASATAADNALFSPTHKADWDRLAVSQKDFRPHTATGTEAQGGPLLTVSWHQHAPYNDFCPIGDGGRTVVGCVATATAQILKFWEWPTSGVGSHYYTWAGDYSCDGSTPSQVLLANYADSYDWANIPDNCGTGCSGAESDALAELNYEVGVAFNMDYGFCGSGTYTSAAAMVFPTHFKYKTSTSVEYRNQFTQQEWFNLIRDEIDAGRPIQYRIRSHSIVCDGYRDDNPSLEFHMNYGWDNAYNAWYVLDNLYCSWVDGDVCPYEEEYMIVGIEPQLDPALDYALSSVADPAGNGNGLAEAGETVELTVSIQNGGNDAANTGGVLSTVDPYISIITATASFDPLIAWGDVSATVTPFEISVLPGVPDPYLAEFELALTADGGYSEIKSFSLFVGCQPGVEDDLESGEAGWSHYALVSGHVDEWHLETYRSHTSSTSWKMGGPGGAGYSNNADGCLVTRSILLPADAKLTFWHWMDAEDDAGGLAWDGGAVEISTDGLTWTRIDPVGGYPNALLFNSSSSLGAGTFCYSGSFGWTEAVFDLSAYSGLVQIMFRFGSDGGTVEEGWYVDDIWVGNTLVGSNVEVHPASGTTVTFNSVTSRGITGMEVSVSGPAVPGGHEAVPEAAPVYCELSTDAGFAGEVDVCFEYDEAEVVGTEDRVRLLHHDGVDWVDITTSLDTEADRVCGSSATFSPFLVAVKMSCCEGRVGDANGSGDDDPTIGDITVLIDMLFGSEQEVACLAEADVNQSGGAEPTAADITISDVTLLIDYLFITGSTLILNDCL